MNQYRPCRSRVCAALVAVLTIFGLCSPAAGQTAAPTNSGVHLPGDEAAHQKPTEWWYFSGHLTAVDSAGQTHRYGFEYVTFQFLGEAPTPVYIGNLSVTDLSRHRFVYAAQEEAYQPPTTPGSFNLHTGPWSMRGGYGDDVLDAALPGYALQLHLHSTKPAALHGTNGIIPFGPFGTSAYYSRTSMTTAGTIVDHGRTMAVRGLSWMDHQWGAIDFASGGGWDWFSVQLRDGRQYMLYFIRDSAGQVVQTVGTAIGARGAVTHLAPGTFAERALGTWRSSVTQITYSSGWRVRVPGGYLNVRPLLKNQELDLRAIQGVAYWEGDVAISGRIDGRSVGGAGYTEINPANQP